MNSELNFLVSIIRHTHVLPINIRIRNNRNDTHLYCMEVQFVYN
jgi:hypothetical protein